MTEQLTTKKYFFLISDNHRGQFTLAGLYDHSSRRDWVGLDPEAWRIAEQVSIAERGDGEMPDLDDVVWADDEFFNSSMNVQLKNGHWVTFYPERNECGDILMVSMRTIEPYYQFPFLVYEYEEYE